MTEPQGTRASAVLGLSPGVALVGDGARVRVVAETWTLALEDFAESALVALGQLASGTSTADQILEDLASSAHAGDGSVASWLALLETLQERGAVTCSLTAEGDTLMRWRPGPDGCLSVLPDMDGQELFAISRYACLRPSAAARWTLECPLARCPVEITDLRVVDLVTRLAGPATLTTLAGEGLSLPEDAVESAVSVLVGLGLVQRNKEREARSRSWSFRDLFFHGRSGQQWSTRLQEMPDGPPGAPSTRLPPADPTFALTEPGPAPQAGRPTLAEVLERRASIREYDDARPITLTELGDLLHRALRVKRTVAGDGAASYEHSNRPYPSGGALHPLHVYAVVRTCAGLDGGVYRYDPRGHGLGRRDDLAERAEDAMRLASAAMGGVPAPQVLLVVAASPSRVFRKYPTIGYALILKEVGALMQTLYLVATSMGLAPCALGAGDGLLLPGVTDDGFDPDEVSVGGFCLGSSRP